MSTVIIYEVTIKNGNIRVIAEKLKKVGLTVEIKDVGKSAFDSNNILCSEIFLECEPIMASINARIKALKDMAGIQDAKFIHEAKLKEKWPWLPPIISTVAYAVTILGVLLGIERDYSLKYDLMTYVFYLIIPSIASLSLGLLAAYKKRVFI